MSLNSHSPKLVLAALAAVAALVVPGVGQDAKKGTKITFTSQGKKVDLIVRDGDVVALVDGKRLAQPKKQGADLVSIRDAGGNHYALVTFGAQVPQEKKKKRMRIGVQMKDVDEALAAQVECRPAEAFLIVKVLPKTPAEKAGIQKYDVITKVNGKSPATQDLLLDVLKETGSGESVSLDVVRGGRRLTVDVAPEEVPSTTVGVMPMVSPLKGYTTSLAVPTLQGTAGYDATKGVYTWLNPTVTRNVPYSHLLYATKAASAKKGTKGDVAAQFASVEKRLRRIEKLLKRLEARHK